MKTLLIIISLIIVTSSVSNAYSLDQWADAIRQAEGNTNYGVLTHYKHTTPRQACKNTVWHRWVAYKKSGLKTPFVAFLGASYAPIGADNDPNGLNINWQHNVMYFLIKEAR